MRYRLLFMIVSVPFVAGAGGGGTRAPEPKTQEAVLAASDDWIAAERLGNVAEVDRRLAPGYLDVEANGRPHVKAELLNHTATRKDLWSGTAKQVAEQFHKKFPSVQKVTLEGNTAILGYYRNDPQLGSYLVGEDTFAYTDGMWKGVFSSHFNAPK